MADFYIYAGLSDKFGGPDYIETRYDTDFSEALDFARETAEEVFQRSVGDKGILTIDHYREIAKDELCEEDYEDLEAFKEAKEDYAQELYAEYMEECISYSAVEADDEDDEDDDEYPLDYYDEDEDEDDDEDDD